MDAPRRHQSRGADPEIAVGIFRHVVAADVQHVAATVGSEQSQRGALALQYGVSGHGCAMENILDLLAGDASFLKDARDADAKGARLIFWRCGCLDLPQAAGLAFGQGDVGESAADVDGDGIPPSPTRQYVACQRGPSRRWLYATCVTAFSDTNIKLAVEWARVLKICHNVANLQSR